MAVYLSFLFLLLDVNFKARRTLFFHTFDKRFLKNILYCASATLQQLLASLCTCTSCTIIVWVEEGKWWVEAHVVVICFISFSFILFKNANYVIYIVSFQLQNIVFLLLIAKMFCEIIFKITVAFKKKLNVYFKK